MYHFCLVCLFPFSLGTHCSTTVSTRLLHDFSRRHSLVSLLLWSRIRKFSQTYQTKGQLPDVLLHMFANRAYDKRTKRLLKSPVPERAYDQYHRLAPRNFECCRSRIRAQNLRLSVATRRRRLSSRTTPSQNQLTFPLQHIGVLLSIRMLPTCLKNDQWYFIYFIWYLNKRTICHYDTRVLISSRVVSSAVSSQQSNTITGSRD